MESLHALIKTKADLDFWLPIFSLGVAALAVFVGPLITFMIGRLQSKVTLAVAKLQIEASLAANIRQTIAPMRQKWTDNLRDRVAEYDSVAAWFYRAAYKPLTGDEFASKEYDQTTRMIFLRQQIALMLNPNEGDHNALIDCLELVQRAAWNRHESEKLSSAMHDLNICCKKILKQEWNRVKRGD